jgi:hypothetical protein
MHQLEGRAPRNKVTVAIANKLARIAWAVLSKTKLSADAVRRATHCPVEQRPTLEAGSVSWPEVLLWATTPSSAF